MDSSGRDKDYYIKRQKNNEAARLSRIKKKEKELETEQKKKKLEAEYIQLHHDILQLHKMKLDEIRHRAAILRRQT